MYALTAQASPRTKLRLTRRGRWLVLLLALCLSVTVLVSIALSYSPSATASVAGSSSQFSYFTVQAGQNLWTIAEEVAPTADPREVIAEIISLNQLKTSSVQSGQRLALPARYAP